MKKTPFNEIEKELGAKMVEYAGYEMPISFSSINEEHKAVRNSVGMFDVSHMGEIILKGENALALIQKLCTNDASKLSDGKAQYTCMTNPDGGIVDDLIVYCLEKDRSYMLVVNASNIQKDWEWMKKNNTEDVEMHDISDRTALLAVQGPRSIEVIQKLLDEDVAKLPYYHFLKTRFADVDNVIISATGYTGSGGVEIYFEDKGEDARKIWNAINEAGAEYGIQACGLGSRDTLRMEMGYCLYGNDIDDSTSPIEAGLGWITKFNKPFNGDKILQEQKEKGVDRKLKGFVMIDRGIPRKGYTIHDDQGEEIGHVTSGTQSPSTGKAIGIGYIASEYAAVDKRIFVKVRDKMLEAIVHKFPFYNHP